MKLNNDSPEHITLKGNYVGDTGLREQQNEAIPDNFRHT